MSVHVGLYARTRQFWSNDDFLAPYFAGPLSSSLRECRHILSLSDVSKCIDDSRRNPQAMTGICRGGVSPSSSLVDSAPFEIIFFRDLQPMMFATSNQ